MTTVIPVHAICATMVSWLVGVLVAYKRNKKSGQKKEKKLV